jgi:hypothetical protein
MATINLGTIKFNWKGSYSGATAYVVDDVVESSGSSYICIAATTGNAPPNASYWEQMSSAGTNGTDGTDLTTTLTTQGDILYRDGSGLQRLGAGTSGQFLKTQGTGANPVWGEAGGKFESALLHITHEDVDASNGGTATSGSWQTGTLNTIKTNEITSASLSSNTISLPAGNYYLIGEMFLTNIGYGQSRLRDTTNSTTLVVGNNFYTEGYAGGSSNCIGRFTLSATTNIQFQYYTLNTYATTGQGFNSPTSGEVNRWKNVQIWKI